MLTTLFSTAVAVAQEGGTELQDPGGGSAEQPVPPTVISSEQLFATGEAFVDGYLVSRDSSVEKDAGAYRAFLFQILKDAHPDLMTAEKAEAVTYYAIAVLGLPADTQTREADLKDDSSQSIQPSPDHSPDSGYNRTNAVTYARAWVQRDGKKRNTGAPYYYPDFVENDCTNYVSQVARAGGIPSPDGDGTCRDESTQREWYIKKLASPCGWPWQSYRNWAWSTSWSVVNDFRRYMADRKGYLVEAYSANSEAVSLLISRARPGDFIQFDVRSCTSCSWTPTHSVAVVEFRNNGGYYSNDLWYNDHSGGTNGNDSVNASLRGKYQSWSSQNLTGLRRMVWIRMP